MKAVTVETVQRVINRLQAGDPAAYAEIMQRFQDMAVGYAFAVLGDWQLAEDAAQEAFIDAYFALPRLREPAAFPGWFRRLVQTRVHRLRRAPQLQTVSLDVVAETAASDPDPVSLVEQDEIQDYLLTAIAVLPEAQRTVVTLFYISEYSQHEISAFLGILISTVKMRLYHARKRLKEHLLSMLQNTLYHHRPSRNETFQQDVQVMIDLVKQRPAQRIGDYPSIIDLQELMGMPETSANTRLWEDTNGQPLGFAIVNPKYSTLDFELATHEDPTALLGEMIAWVTERLRQAGLDTVRTQCRDDNQPRWELLALLGFVAEPIGTLHMRRSLTVPLPEPHLPTGFTIQPVAGEQAVEQLETISKSVVALERSQAAQV